MTCLARCRFINGAVEPIAGAPPDTDLIVPTFEVPAEVDPVALINEIQGIKLSQRRAKMAEAAAKKKGGVVDAKQRTLDKAVVFKAFGSDTAQSYLKNSQRVFSLTDPASIIAELGVAWMEREDVVYIGEDRVTTCEELGSVTMRATAWALPDTILEDDKLTPHLIRQHYWEWYYSSWCTADVRHVDDLINRCAILVCSCPVLRDNQSCCHAPAIALLVRQRITKRLNDACAAGDIPDVPGLIDDFM